MREFTISRCLQFLDYSYTDKSHPLCVVRSSFKHRDSISLIKSSSLKIIIKYLVYNLQHLQKKSKRNTIDWPSSIILTSIKAKKINSRRLQQRGKSLGMIRNDKSMIISMDMSTWESHLSQKMLLSKSHLPRLIFLKRSWSSLQENYSKKVWTSKTSNLILLLKNSQQPSELWRNKMLQ